MVEPIRLDYAANDAEVIAAFKRQQAELERERGAREKLQKQINDNARAQRDADKAAIESAREVARQNEKLAADAAKISASVRTPLEQYRVGLKELVEHYKAGRISQEEYHRASDKLKATYDEQTGKTARLKEAERAKNEQMKEAVAILKSIQSPQDKYAANVAKLTELHKQGHLSIDQYNKAVAAEQKTLDKSKESSDAFGGALSGMSGKLMQVVGGFASMQTVISFVKAEYDALIERQGKAADANISLAAEQEALLMNIGGENSQKIVDQIAELSGRSGVKQENVTRAVNEAMAARGDFAVGDVIDAVGSAAKIRKFAPSELAGLASATVDVRKQTGLGTDESLGFLLQLQAQSRTKSLKELSANFTPAVGGLMQMGADRQTAGALLASLSHGMGDTSGAQTKTASLQLASQLREFGGGAPLAQVIQNLQGNAGLRNKFLSTMTSEVAARPAIESLLSGGNVARQFGSTMQALRANPLDALASAEKSRNLGAMNIAEKEMRFSTNADSAKLNNRSEAESAVIRDSMQEIMLSYGGSKFGTQLRSAFQDVATGGLQTDQSALSQLEFMLAERKRGISDKVYGAGLLDVVAPQFGLVTGGISGQMAKNANDPEFQKQTKSLEELVMLQRQLVEQQKQGAHAGVVGARGNNQNEGAPR